MSKIIVVAVICSLFLAIQAASLQKHDVTTIVVGNLTEYMRSHGLNKTITNLNSNNNVRGKIIYTLGKRISGKFVS